jgi:hypothetical protein
MPIDLKTLLIQLTSMLADQVKINADLGAEVDALILTLEARDRGFQPVFRENLAQAKQSESYLRQVGTAELIRKRVG